MNKDFSRPLYRHANGLKELNHSKIEKFLLNELNEMYFTEKNLVKALPKIQASTISFRLKKAYEVQFEFTKKQVLRLELIFEKLKYQPVLIRKDFHSDTYSLSSYVGLAKLASRLGHHQVAVLLEESLQQENAADKLLFDLAHFEEILEDVIR